MHRLYITPFWIENGTLELKINVSQKRGPTINVIALFTSLTHT